MILITHLLIQQAIKKYLKTTAYGLNGYGLDYAFLLVGANIGVLRMTEEHLGLIVSLNIHLLIITKIDMS